MFEQAPLTREQKQAVGILSIGTFLEYFDLMLYVHMAVLLNDLFFLKTDSFSASIIGAFAFCSTFLFRPVGAFLIGYLGDTYGRKNTIILTSMLMAGSCVAMASLPTYAQIGVSTSILVTLCRIIQGISSMGEAVGAVVYVSEIINPPKVYPAVAFIYVCCFLGTMTALFVAKLSISDPFNWRVAFLIGAVVAFVGIFARTRLGETPEFAGAKRKYKKMFEELNYYKKIKNNILLIKTFDRLHNMQTIIFKAIEKQKKIAYINFKPIISYS